MRSDLPPLCAHFHRPARMSLPWGPRPPPCPSSCSEHMNIVFIGHVDAGKSTTAGQILFLTGGVDDRTIEKYEREAKEKNRESWYMAYIMDTNEEERAKVGGGWGCAG